MLKYEDYLGQDIEVGDLLTYPVRQGSEMWTDCGVVTELTTSLGQSAVRIDKENGQRTMVWSLGRSVAVKGAAPYTPVKADKADKHPEMCDICGLDYDDCCRNGEEECIIAEEEGIDLEIEVDTIIEMEGPKGPVEYTPEPAVQLPEPMILNISHEVWRRYMDHHGSEVLTVHNPHRLIITKLGEYGEKHYIVTEPDENGSVFTYEIQDEAWSIIQTKNQVQH